MLDGHCAGLRFLAPVLTLYLLLASSELRAEQPRSWNAFAAAQKIALPPPNDGPDSWLHHPIDRFILKGLDEAGLAPSPPATPRILIRRLSFNLVGLPPSPELLEKFTADPSDTNYRAIVDDLLASPNYGERWARHWLDVARYGESNGFEYNEPRRNAWPYRDWVIQALNDNFPYDQFAREQIAGKAEAIGFLVAGVHRSPSGANDIMSAQERHDGLEEMVGTLRQAFLGITAQCARCHDHPTDPIPTADYYRLAAALAGTRHPVPKTKQKSYSVVSKKSEVMHVFHRGDTTQPREEVNPGGLSALANPSPDFALDAGSNDSERRKKLAEWITHPDNDLFTRVIVNRIWHYHFGTGIVSTPSDFGKSGGPPSHPELLDWLAHWFRTNGYSLKKLHHLIVTSQSYRQAATYRQKAAAIDQEARFLWRFRPKRLEGEAVRDALLAVAGVLNPKRGGPGFHDTKTIVNGGAHFYFPIDPIGIEFNRRTIYRFSPRGERSTLLDCLDCPDPSGTAPRRSVTTTPLQALSLQNNSFIWRMADHFADRLKKEAGAELESQIERAWILAVGRPPAEEEHNAALTLVENHGLAALGRALFNSSEFIVVE